MWRASEPVLVRRGCDQRARSHQSSHPHDYPQVDRWSGYHSTTRIADFAVRGTSNPVHFTGNKIMTGADYQVSDTAREYESISHALKSITIIVYLCGLISFKYLIIIYV